MKSNTMQWRWCWAAVLPIVVACGSDSNEVAGPNNAPPLTSGTLVIDHTAALLTGIGQSRRLVARATDERGAPVSAAVTWSSSAPNDVGVDATGLIEARAIGSAMIFAESGGIRSAPVFVVVAEPRPGALLVRDAQVLAVVPPTGLAASEVPGVGTRYDVRLTGVATPSTGTVVLAT